MLGSRCRHIAVRHVDRLRIGLDNRDAWLHLKGYQRQLDRGEFERDPEMTGGLQGELHYIAPRKPLRAAPSLPAGQWMQNGFVENFNGRMRDEFLNEHLFGSLRQGRNPVEVWRHTQASLG